MALTWALPLHHSTHIVSSAGVEGTYGPDDASVKAIVDSSKQSAQKSPEVQEQDAGEYTSPACYAHLDAPREVLKGDAHDT